MEQTIYTVIMERLKSVVESSAFDLFFENGPPPDFVNQRTPFVMAEVVVDEVYKASIEAGQGVRRYEGYLALGLFAPEGSGAQGINKLRSDLDDAFMSQYIGPVLMKGSAAMRPPDIAQWFGRGVQYAFCVNNLPS